MRMDQYVGLTLRAYEWLAENAVHAIVETLSVTYVNGIEMKRESATVSKLSQTVHDHIQGAWNEDFAPLQRTQLQNGREVEEYIQDEVWSSGPMYFLALRYVCKSPCLDGCLCTPSLAGLAWTDAEIAAEG